MPYVGTQWQEVRPAIGTNYYFWLLNIPTPALHSGTRAANNAVFAVVETQSALEHSWRFKTRSLAKEKCLWRCHNVTCCSGTSLVNIEGYNASAKLQDDGSVFLEPELLVEDTTTALELPRINYSYNGRKHKWDLSICCADCEGLACVPATLAYSRFFSRKILVTQYESVGTRFLWF